MTGSLTTECSFVALLQLFVPYTHEDVCHFFALVLRPLNWKIALQVPTGGGKLK
jgi:hypothetical protein